MSLLWGLSVPLSNTVKQELGGHSPSPGKVSHSISCWALLIHIEAEVCLLYWDSSPPCLPPTHIHTAFLGRSVSSNSKDGLPKGTEFSPLVLVIQNILENTLRGTEAEAILDLQNLSSWQRGGHTKWMLRTLSEWQSQLTVVSEFHRKDGICRQCADDIAQPVKVLIFKSGGLSFICRIYMVNGKNQFLQIVLLSIPCHGHTYTQTHTTAGTTTTTIIN